MKRQILISSLAALFLAACSVLQLDQNTAEVEVAAAPAEPALEVSVHEGDFATIQQFVTPGGVSVWLVEEPSIPILSLQASWKGGWASDPEGLEGLADMVAYQMNEGAGDKNALAYQTAMEALNMSFYCDASRDWTNCYGSMLSDNAADSFALMASAFEAPRFDEGPFERQQRENLISIRQRETNAGFLAGEAIENTLYPDHPYAREKTESSVTAITREDALAHKDRLMVKDRLLVTAVGAVSARELAPMIDDVFAALPETSELADIPPVILGAPLSEPILVELPQPQSLVSFIAPGLSRDHPDFFTAYVLNYTFGGGGFESRIMKELRVAKGLTYGVYSRLNFGGQAQTWSGSGQTKNESAGEFVDGLKEEMRKLVEEGVTSQELEDAKAYLTGAYALGFDSNAKIAGNMMAVRQQELGIDYFDRRNASILNVTLEDVNRVARQFLEPDNFLFVVVGEPQGLGEE